MKNIAGTILIVISLSGAIGAQVAKPSLNDLSWLAGCWEANRNGRELTEQWMKPAGQTMLGMGRTVANGKTVEFEFLQIVEREDAVYYVARPSGQPEASFKAIKLAKQEVIFENPEHDFPQRIIYRLQTDGALFARIEGTANGKARGFEYPMQRGRCN